MKPKSADWYKHAWTLDIKNQSWTENTSKQVDFLEKVLGLTGRERILDLGCGYGRHSLELARRGYRVVGVDITPAYIEDAKKTAAEEHLDVQFYCMDIRDVPFDTEFDAVLNMADGAIGYLENDAENLKIFDRIAAALKPGGKSFVDLQSGDYAAAHFPVKLWDAGEKMLTLSNFEWNSKTHILLYGQVDFAYGEPLPKPEMLEGDPTRLYSEAELTEIMERRGLARLAAYADVAGTPASKSGNQLMFVSQKK